MAEVRTVSDRRAEHYVRGSATVDQTDQDPHLQPGVKNRPDCGLTVEMREIRAFDRLWGRC